MTTEEQMPAGTLQGWWALRLSAAHTLLRVEELLATQLAEANPTEIVELVEEFSGLRPRGPEWTNSFAALVEHLWQYCDQADLRAVANEFERRGPMWAAVTNSLEPAYGKEVLASLTRRSPRYKLPTFAIA